MDTVPQRLRELPRVLDERLHVAQLHGPGRHLQPAHHDDPHVHKVPVNPMAGMISPEMTCAS